MQTQKNIEVTTKTQTTSSLEDYLILLSTFIDSGYQIRKFDSKSLSLNVPKLFIRHDVDVSVESALHLARIESEKGLYSSYFFMLRSPFYNLLSTSSIQALTEIYEIGHDICLHIDSSLYTNLRTGLSQEFQVLKFFYPFFKPNIFSLHCPIRLNMGQDDLELNNLYQNTSGHKIFGRPVHYISDSMGEWRYGYPTKSEGFERKESVQLVTHPIWWIQKGLTPIEKIKSCLGGFSQQKIDLIKEFLPKFYKKHVVDFVLDETKKIAE